MEGYLIMWFMMMTLTTANPGTYKGSNEANTPSNGTSHPSLLQSLEPHATKLPEQEEETQPTVMKQKCCENGGLCVMGVFCHCPGKFYGFRCEFERRPCGPIAHGQWARLGCNLCRCYDAKLHCLTKVYSGCDDKPIKTDIEVSDYPDDMVIFPKDESTYNQATGSGNAQNDNDYEDYSEASNDESYRRSSSARPLAPSLHFTMLLTLSTVIVFAHSSMQVSVSTIGLLFS